MMAANFSPERADAIEGALITHVSRHPHRKHRTARTAGLLLTGALVGVGATTGAIAATDMLRPAAPQTAAHSASESSSALPDAVTAPAGVTPGMPIISLLDDQISLIVDTPTQVPLTDRPAETTHARVTVTPTNAGALSWGTNLDNNPTASWTTTEVAQGSSTASYDFPLEASVDTLYLDPTGFAGVVTVQFVAYEPTLVGVNANGQTYGSSSTSDDLDLIAVIATNGEFGYVYREALDLATGATEAEDFTSPAEALQWQEKNGDKIAMLLVYLSDGVTKVGEFEVNGP